MNVSFPALAPIDGARAALLRSLGAPGRALLRDPSLRVATYGVVGIALTLLLTCVAPLHAFVYAPLVLGVPHLLADVRYLVVRPGLARRRALAIGAGAPLALSALTASPALGLLACVVVALLSRGSHARRGAIGGVAATATGLALAHPTTTALVLAHAHNAVGAVFVLAVFSRKRRLEAIPVIAFAAVSAALLLGVFDAVLLRPFALRAPAGGVSLGAAVAQLAPTSDPILAVRLVALFVFAQGVHYVAWLRLVPELGRERPGIRGFSSSVRALVRDFGVSALVFAAVGAVALVVLAASRSASSARDVYLHIASFHAPLELAILALVAIEGRGTLSSS